VQYIICRSIPVLIYRFLCFSLCLFLSLCPSQVVYCTELLYLYHPHEKRVFIGAHRLRRGTYVCRDAAHSSQAKTNQAYGSGGGESKAE
jgi:hypothetical protein